MTKQDIRDEIKRLEQRKKDSIYDNDDHYDRDIEYLKRRIPFETMRDDLVGKYVNRLLWTDADPVGKIVGVKGKDTVIIQPIVAGKNKNKMEFIAGGFGAHCTNNREQSYDFEEAGEAFEERLTFTKLEKYSWYIHDAPTKHYDYNF